VRIVSIVVVPGAGTLTADRWGWLQSLGVREAPSEAHYAVYVFEHRLLDEKDVLDWDRVGRAGTLLLDALQELTVSRCETKKFLVRTR
jgi:hypothetical protein